MALLCTFLTAGGEADSLLELLVAGGRQAEGHRQHGALGGPHQQTGIDHAVGLPGETQAEVKGGDGLSRFSVYAGDT